MWFACAPQRLRSASLRITGWKLKLLIFDIKLRAYALAISTRHIDLRKMVLAWDMPVGKAPAGVIWQNGRVLVANMGSDDVAIVDPRDGRVIERLKIGKGTHTLFRSPDGKHLWVNSRIDSTVTVLDATSLKVVRTYKLPGGPDDLVFAPDGKIWFTLRFAHKVAVLDPTSGTFTTIAVGRSPHGIFINPLARPAK